MTEQRSARAIAGGDPGDPRVVIVLQARMTSTRLPGKVLMPILDKPVLGWVIERLQRVTASDGLVVATTTNATDDPIATLAREMGCAVTRGSEHDVLDRYRRAAEEAAADIVVRATSDCPLIDPTIVDRLIGQFLDASVDYAATYTHRMTWPVGLDVEVFWRATLERAWLEATETRDREHVTIYIKKHPDKFSMFAMESPIDLHHYHWAVDTVEDFQLVSRIMSALAPTNPEFGLADMLAVAEANPDWQLLNVNVPKKYHGIDPETDK